MRYKHSSHNRTCPSLWVDTDQTISLFCTKERSFTTTEKTTKHASSESSPSSTVCNISCKISKQKKGLFFKINTGEIQSAPNLSLALLCRQCVGALVWISSLFRSQFLLLPQAPVAGTGNHHVATVISCSECGCTLTFAVLTGNCFNCPGELEPALALCHRCPRNSHGRGSTYQSTRA